METTEKIITNAELLIFWPNNGIALKRQKLASVLTKCQNGEPPDYYSGMTARKLGLVMESRWELTEKGSKYLSAHGEVQ